MSKVELRTDNQKFAYHVIGEICRGTKQDVQGTLSPEQAQAFESLLHTVYGYVAFARTEELAGRYRSAEWDEAANAIVNEQARQKGDGQ